ncbi:MAG: hypothetical protein H6684_09120 [Deltaproteobacteria bacterium]|nr:hypothetical protein [Deltaproteobacteria bacterium]
MALDSTGAMHLAYVQYSTGKMIWLHNRAGGWTYNQVRENPDDPPKGLRMRIGPSDKIYLGYLFVDQQILFLSSESGGVWTHTGVDNRRPLSATQFDFGVAQDGRILFAYNSTTSGQELIRIATRGTSDSAWYYQILLSRYAEYCAVVVRENDFVLATPTRVLPDNDYVIQIDTISVDGDDQIHIDTTTVPGTRYQSAINGAINEQGRIVFSFLDYVTQSGGYYTRQFLYDGGTGWETGNLIDKSVSRYGFDIVLNSTGDFDVVVPSENRVLLRNYEIVATTADAQVNSEFVLTDSPYEITAPSLALDSQDVAAIFYAAVDEEDEGDLKLVAPSGPDHSYATIYQNPTTQAIVNSDLANYDDSTWAIGYRVGSTSSTFAKLTVVYENGSRSTSLPSADGSTNSVCVAVDGQNRILFAAGSGTGFGDIRSLEYRAYTFDGALHSQESESFETNTRYGRCSISMDDDGVHILANDGSARYFTDRSGSWVAELVAVSLANGSLSATSFIDEFDILHFFMAWTYSSDYDNVMGSLDLTDPEAEWQTEAIEEVYGVYEAYGRYWSDSVLWAEGGERFLALGTPAKMSVFAENEGEWPEHIFDFGGTGTSTAKRLLDGAVSDGVLHIAYINQYGLWYAQVDLDTFLAASGDKVVELDDE